MNSRAAESALRATRRIFARLSFAAVVSAALLTHAARAGQQSEESQQPQLKIKTQEPQLKIAVEVKSVSVLATVRDKHGKIIPNLNKEDFQLEEDGRPQKIDYFAHESDVPLRLGLLVDTSLSQRKVIDQERSASYSFLDHLLRENKDLAFVIHFDHEVELLQDFTASRPKLQAALQQLQTPQFTAGGGGNGNGDGGYGGGTQLYDAIFLASDELMSKQQGRKALIILSDGVDHGSRETLGEAIASAQRADTIIYSIYFADEDQGSGFGGRPGFGVGGHGGRGGGRPRPQEQRPDGKKILEQISQETGGRLFKASSKKDSIDECAAC